MAIVTIGTGLTANDGQGDSIRDAFIKTNANFNFLDTLTKNLTTNNLTTTGNVIVGVSSDKWIYFRDGTGVDKRVALEGTVFTGGEVANPTLFKDLTQADQDLTSTSGYAGAVQVYGGLAVAKNIVVGGTVGTDLVPVATVKATAISTISLGSVTADLTGKLTAGSAEIKGAITTGTGVGQNGNITIGVASAGNISGFKATFSQVTGTLQTNAQPYITSIGTLNVLSTTGNVTSANVTTGNISLTGNISANNVSVTTNLKAAWSEVTGNMYSLNVNAGVGTFANATVQDVPSNYHVTNKGYVNSTVVAFAIGLGS
jgi:hypothetical protein